MAMSGIKCDESVTDVYGQLTKGDRSKRLSYIIFMIEKEGEGRNAIYKKIVVEKTGGPGKTLDDLKDDLTRDAPRYAVFDLAYTNEEGQQREKIIFLTLVPPGIKDKFDRMVYSSTEKELKQKLGTASFAHSFHFDDHNEIDMNEMVNQLRKLKG